MGEEPGEVIAGIGPGGEATRQNEQDRQFHGRFACWVMARSCDRVAVRMSRRFWGRRTRRQAERLPTIRRRRGAPSGRALPRAGEAKCLR